MLIINKDIIFCRKDIDDIIERKKEKSYKKEYDDIAEIFRSYLYECHSADVKLQEMVYKKMGDGFTSIVILPHDFYKDDLSSISFRLENKEGEKVKLRNQRFYEEFCEVCFLGIKPFFLRVVDYYQNRKLYI